MFFILKNTASFCGLSQQTHTGWINTLFYAFIKYWDTILYIFWITFLLFIFSVWILFKDLLIFVCIFVVFSLYNFD